MAGAASMSAAGTVTAGRRLRTIVPADGTSSRAGQVADPSR
ncbi:hypothetical protein [Pseudonocardia sp.]